jgi:hypothetical protein
MFSVKPEFDDDDDDDDIDEEFERRRKEFQKRERLEKAGKLPQIVGEANRKIVGLVDSDDEDDGRHRLGPGVLGKKPTGGGGGGGKKPKPNEQEDKLAKELKELEQTFKSFEDDERKGWGLSRSGKNHETQSAFTPSNRNQSENNGGSWSASPPSFPRNAPKTSHRSRGGPTPFVNSKPTLTRTLKFSWDEQTTVPQDKNSDEWTYKQVSFIIKYVKIIRIIFQLIDTQWGGSA